MNHRETITVSQAAAKLGVCPAWARRLCMRHRIGFKVGPRMRLLSRGDLQKLTKLLSGSSSKRG